MRILDTITFVTVFVHMVMFMLMHVAIFVLMYVVIFVLVYVIMFVRMVVVHMLCGTIGSTEAGAQAVGPDDALLPKAVAYILNGDGRHLEVRYGCEDRCSGGGYELTFDGTGYPGSFDAAQYLQGGGCGERHEAMCHTQMTTCQGEW